MFSLFKKIKDLFKPQQKFICAACKQARNLSEREFLDPPLCRECIDRDNEREAKLFLGQLEDGTFEEVDFFNPDFH